MAKQIIGLNNVVQITTLDIGNMLSVFREKNKVVSFMGAPGVGKTASIKQWAKEEAVKQKKTFIECPKADDWDNPNNFCYSVVLASQIEEIDTRGLPNVTTKKDGDKITVYTLTELFPSNGTGLIVLDEFPNGRTSVQNALQPMLLEHKAGNIKISDNIQFVVAGNRPSDNCGTFFIPSALRNRIGWFEVSKPKVEDWLDKMEEIGQPINSSMAAFMLSVGHKYFDNFDPRAEQYAYGTTRSVHMASEVIEGVQDHETIKKLVGSFVGADAGMEFIAFLKLTEKVDLKEILDNPDKIHKYEDDLGVLYSISLSLIDKAVENQANTEKVLAVIGETKKREHGVFILKGLMNKLGASKAHERIVKCKNAPEVMTKYHQMLKRVTALNN